MGMDQVKVGEREIKRIAARKALAEKNENMAPLYAQLVEHLERLGIFGFVDLDYDSWSAVTILRISDPETLEWFVDILRTVENE